MCIRVLINDVDNIDLIDLMNEYLKLKIKYWTIDFVKLTLDIDYVYVENDVMLNIVSHDIFSSELVFNELSNICKFFDNHKIKINGSIEKKIDKSICDFIIINYEIFMDTLIYKMKKFCHNSKIDEKNIMKYIK